MGWDGFQREVLAALGHQVFDLATAQPVAELHSTALKSDASPIPDTGEAAPLLQAIARAAGVEISALPPLPPPEQLRSPAAKRTLWPRLRALRSARTQRLQG